jgi:hypothetical protein
VSDGIMLGWKEQSISLVMPGFMPGIHVLTIFRQKKTWMAGTSPAMTRETTCLHFGRTA